MIQLPSLLSPHVRHSLPRASRAIAAVAACAILLAGCATESGVVSLSREAMDKRIAGQKRYEFTVRPDGTLIAPGGEEVLPEQVSAYLARTKPDQGAFFVLRLQMPAALPAAKAAIKRFSAYGAHNFAVTMNEQVVPPAESNASGEKNGKTAVLVGKPNPKSHSATDAPPEMAARPAELRPGKLPRQVRYRFATDDEVLRGAAAVRALLIAPADGDPLALFDHVTLLDPGMWARIEHVPVLAQAKPLHASIPLRGRTVVLEGRILQDPKEFATAIGQVRKLIMADGGADLHAMTSEEMARWWPFIGLDIEEPVFVLETKARHYRFVVALSHDKVFLLDDLKGLPPI